MNKNLSSFKREINFFKIEIPNISLKIALILFSYFGFYSVASAQIGNYTVGQGSSTAMTSDDYNVAVGDSTLTKQIGEHYVTALGYKAGYNNDQDENIFIGYEAGFTNITGADNLFVLELVIIILLQMELF